jgi:hypothetical protein
MHILIAVYSQYKSSLNAYFTHQQSSIGVFAPVGYFRFRNLSVQMVLKSIFGCEMCLICSEMVQ